MVGDEAKPHSGHLGMVINLTDLGKLQFLSMLEPTASSMVGRCFVCMEVWKSGIMGMRQNYSAWKVHGMEAWEYGN